MTAISILVCFFQGILHIVCAKSHVATPIGDIIGYKAMSTLDMGNRIVWTYLGIPYAEPPLGQNRFKKPIPKHHFSVHNGSTHGPACPQDPSMMQKWIPGTPYMSEDCLSLNIYVPEPTPGRPKPTSGYPVMVWFHGGAFVIGQSSLYRGENLAAFGDVIVVTVNYRIGPFGFLVIDDSVSDGNYGLWDQHLALQWVHFHIGDFGGNNRQVTIFGESAGGASCIYQSMFPGNKGLFQRFISESGSAYSAWAYISRDKTIEFGKRMGRKLNCSNVENGKELLSCLQSKSMDDIIANMRVGSQLETIFRPEFAPVVDNDIISVEPNSAFGPKGILSTEILEMFSSVDGIIGINSGDGGFIAMVGLLAYLDHRANKTGLPKLQVLEEEIIPLVIRERFDVSTANMIAATSFVYRDWSSVVTNTTHLNEIMDISSDIFFFIPALFTAKTHKISGARSTYLFRFSHHSPFLPVINWVPGAGHGDEIPYVFGFPLDSTMYNAYGYTNTSIGVEERSLSNSIMTYWTNFAKTGDPNMPAQVVKQPVWPKYDTTMKHFIELESNCSIENHMFADRESLWSTLLPVLLDNIHSFLHHSLQPVQGFPGPIG